MIPGRKTSQAVAFAGQRVYDGGATSVSGSVSESVSKRLEMGFGHEKLDVYRTAIEYGYAVRED